MAHLGTTSQERKEDGEWLGNDSLLPSGNTHTHTHTHTAPWHALPSLLEEGGEEADPSAGRSPG